MLAKQAMIGQDAVRSLISATSAICVTSAARTYEAKIIYYQPHELEIVLGSASLRCRVGGRQYQRRVVRVIGLDTSVVGAKLFH